MSEMGEEFIEEDGGEGTVEAVSEAADQTVPVSNPAEVVEELEQSSAGRHRRATLVSPIPAILAASMTTLAEGKVSRGRSDSGAHYTVELETGDAAPAAAAPAELSVDERFAQSLAAARKSFEARDFHLAACLAEEALTLGEALATVASQEVLAASQPLFERIFGAFVGPLAGTPALACSWEQILAHRLGDSTRSFLRRIDGVRTLEQTLGHSSIPPQHALRIAASALRAGFIRIA
ncbi:MAG TPA: hypothetical protein VNO55_32050 [Polyangia bacterium]|nr:hypothetical protein [Polyangia bacterium]